MKYFIADENRIIIQADRLLHEELWSPLGFPEKIREDFKAGRSETVVVAQCGDHVVGSFILVDYGDGTAEIRHAAVAGNFQFKGVGTGLFEHVLKHVSTLPDISALTVYTRNTSFDFWRKLGFKESSEWLDHPLFAHHGIRFNKMTFHLTGRAGKETQLTGEKGC